MRRNIALLTNSKLTNATRIKIGKGTYSDIGLRESTRYQVLAQSEISEFDIVVCVQEDCEPITSHQPRATRSVSDCLVFKPV